MHREQTYRHGDVTLSQLYRSFLYPFFGNQGIETESIANHWFGLPVHTIQAVNPSVSGDTVPELRLAPTSEECEDSKFAGD